MATTRLIPLHVNKGKTVAETLEKRMKYIKNPDKTNEGILIKSYECNPKSAVEDFMISKGIYEKKKSSESEKSVIAYHVRQAFKPGEITPELANKIGYDLAKKFTNGKHQFIVSTHVDKDQVLSCKG